MSDMPSAREHALYDRRRKRASVASGAVLAASLAVLFVSTRVELSALAATAVLAHFALPSWVGIAPEFPFPSMWRAVTGHLFDLAVPALGMCLFYVFLNKGNLSFLVVVPFAVLGAVLYGVYRWRYLTAAMARVRGADDDMSLVGRLWRHYLSYAAGLVAGSLVTLAAAPLTSAAAGGLLGYGVFASGFLVAKAIVDFALPQPSLRAERLSSATSQLAAMSPVWFGVPWGGTAVALSTVASHGALAGEDAVFFVDMTVAAIVVFTAIAAVAFVMELATGEA